MNAQHQNGDIAELRRRVGMWRTATLVVAALALVLAGVAVLRTGIGAQIEGERLVAVLDQPSGPGAILVEIAGGALMVHSRAEPAPERSLQLWYQGVDRPPLALGLIGGVGSRAMALIADIPGFNPRGAVFSVTDEPPGGAPDGVPTGPVLVTGELLPLAD